MKRLDPESRLKRDIAKLLLLNIREDVVSCANNLDLVTCAKLHPHLKESKRILGLKKGKS